jgi:CelD/BcsL family acetyltransferase involved in cellulose biosynthesis
MSRAAPGRGSPPPGGRHPLTVSRESFESLKALRASPDQRLRWGCPFVEPRWLEAWWRCFAEDEPELLAVRREEEALGVAALRIAGDTARVIGDPEVSDHLDIVTAPGAGAAVLATLRRHLLDRGVRRLDLVRVRPDSTAAAELVPAARRLGLAVDFAPRDVAMEIDLPGSWDAYLGGLDGKQRHELRRKLRRLGESAGFRLRLAESDGERDAAIRTFLRLFRLNRPEKARFMTARMEQYFSAIAAGLDAEGRLSLFSLDLDGQTAAVVFCFRHAQRICLYNNAYDERFGPLSVGILSKALSIRESIRAGMRVYDLLRGDEAYKHRLGGRPVALYGCRIDLA